MTNVDMNDQMAGPGEPRKDPGPREGAGAAEHDLASRITDLEARLNESEACRDTEAAEIRRLTLKSSDLEAELRLKGRTARTAPALGAAAETRAQAPPIPSLEPPVDPNWPQALAHLRQGLRAAYSPLHGLTAAIDELEAKLKASEDHRAKQAGDLRKMARQAAELGERLRQAERRGEAAATQAREFAAKTVELEAKLRQVEQRGGAVAMKARQFAAQAVELEAKLRQAEQRGEAAAMKAHQFAAKAAELEAKLRQAEQRGEAAAMQARDFAAQASELGAKLLQAEQRADAETAESRRSAAQAAELESKLRQAEQRGEAAAMQVRDSAAQAAELVSKLRQAEQCAESETAESRRSAAQAAELESKLRQAEKSAESETAESRRAAAQAADFKERLRQAERRAEAAPGQWRPAEPLPPAAPAPPAPPAPPEPPSPALPDSGAAPPEAPFIPSVEPALDSGWAKALVFLRQCLGSSYAQLRKLSAMPLADSQRSLLRLAAGALSQGTDALSVLTEFLDESGGPSARPQSLGSLEALVASALEKWAPALRQRGISVARRMEGAPPQAVFHTEALRLVCYQVLRNAFECMPQGGTLAVRFWKDAASGMSCLSFSDSGPGFSREALASLAAPFVTSKPGHLGLGLALASRVLTRWGGGLEAANNKGAGATVTLRLPAGPGEAPSLQEDPVK